MSAQDITLATTFWQSLLLITRQRKIRIFVKLKRIALISLGKCFPKMLTSNKLNSTTETAAENVLERKFYSLFNRKTLGQNLRLM